MVTRRKVLHHPFGGSSLWRRRMCPGSYREEEELGEVESEGAKFCTAQHLLTEDRIRDWKQGKAQEPPKDPDDLSYYAYEFFTNELEEMLKIIGCGFVSVAPLRHSTRLSRPSKDRDGMAYLLVELESGVDAVCEMRLEVFKENKSLSWGYADVVIFCEPRSIVKVIDFKFGRQPIEGDAAIWQIVSYIIGAMDYARSYYGIEADGEGVIIEVPRRKIHRLKVPHSEKDLYIENIAEIIETAKRKNAPLMTGPHCTYCKALGICEATREEGEEFARELTATTGTTKASVARAIKPYVDSMPAKQLLPYLNMLPRVEAACEAVRARAKMCLEQDGNCLEGWQLIQKKGRRWANIEAAREATKDKITEEEFLACCKIDIPALEERYAAKFETMTEGKREFSEAMGPALNQATHRELRRSRKK